MKLLIDNKPRKIIYNKKDNIYYYNSKENETGKVNVTSYFKENDGSLKKKYKKLLIGGGFNGYIRIGKVPFNPTDNTWGFYLLGTDFILLLKILQNEDFIRQFNKMGNYYDSNHINDIKNVYKIIVNFEKEFTNKKKIDYKKTENYDKLKKIITGNTDYTVIIRKLIEEINDIKNPFYENPNEKVLLTEIVKSLKKFKVLVENLGKVDKDLIFSLFINMKILAQFVLKNFTKDYIYINRDFKEIRDFFKVLNETVIKEYNPQKYTIKYFINKIKFAKYNIVDFTRKIPYVIAVLEKELKDIDTEIKIKKQIKDEYNIFLPNLKNFIESKKTKNPEIIESLNAKLFTFLKIL